MLKFSGGESLLQGCSNQLRNSPARPLYNYPSGNFLIIIFAFRQVWKYPSWSACCAAPSSSSLTLYVRISRSIHSLIETATLFHFSFSYRYLNTAHTNAWIMGLEDDFGTVIPLAMVCKRPMELVRSLRDFTHAYASCTCITTAHEFHRTLSFFCRVPPQSAQIVYRLVVSGDPPRLALPVPPGMVEDTLSADLERAHLEMFEPSALPPPPLRGNRLNRTASAMTVDSEAALPGDYTVGSFRESDSLEAGDKEGFEEDDDRYRRGMHQSEGGGLDEHSAQEEAVVGALRSFAAECGAAGLLTPGEQAALANLLGHGD